MRANAIKNTTPCMPARVWGPRGAPGAPQAFRSASQVSPRRGAGAAQAQPRRCSCCQASPGAPGTRERRKTKARGRRCQALPGASRRTQHSQQLLGAPRRCPIAPRRHQALPWRSHARPRRPPGAPRRGTGAATAATGVSKRFWALPGRRGCLAPPRRSRRSSAPPRRCQTVLNANPKALPSAPQASPGASKRPEAFPGVPEAFPGAPKRCPGAPRRPRALLGAPQTLQGAPHALPSAPQSLPGVARRLQAPPDASPGSASGGAPSCTTHRQCVGNRLWRATHWSLRLRAAPPLHRIGALPEYCA